MYRQRCSLVFIDLSLRVFFVLLSSTVVENATILTSLVHTCHVDRRLVVFISVYCEVNGTVFFNKQFAYKQARSPAHNVCE